MGVSALETVCSRPIDHGRAASTPFALIENGTRTNQRVVTGSLSELVVRARAHGVRAPALLVIGEVAAFADTLAWFGATPLSAPALEQAACSRHRCPFATRVVSADRKSTRLNSSP